MVDALRKLCLEYAIEDSLDTARVIANQLGIPILLLDRPWNRSLEEMQPRDQGRVLRCSDWKTVTATLSQCLAPGIPPGKMPSRKRGRE